MNKKERCPICGRILRTKCFIYNSLEKKEICNRCNKKIGTNKFYSIGKLQHRKSNIISNYNITDDEIKVLSKKKGFNINRDRSILRKIKREKIEEKREIKKKLLEREEQKKKLNEKFLKNLKWVA